MSISGQVYFTFVTLEFTDARNLRPAVLDPFVPSVGPLHVSIHVPTGAFEDVLPGTVRTFHDFCSLRSLRTRGFYSFRVLFIIIAVLIFTDITFIRDSRTRSSRSARFGRCPGRRIPFLHRSLEYIFHKTFDIRHIDAYQIELVR